MSNQQLVIQKSVATRRESIESRFSEWPRNTIARHFKEACDTYHEKPYLYIDNEIITYDEVWEQAITYAKAFISLGVKRREHLAVLMNNDAAYPSLMIAASIVGAVFIPINAMLAKNELKYILAQSDTKHLIIEQTVKDKQHGVAVTELLTDEDFLAESQLHTVICRENEKADNVSKEFLTWETFVSEVNKVTDEQLNARWDLSCYPDEVAMIMYTSGSTGRPKGLMLTDDMLLRCAYGTCLSRAIEEGRVTLAPLPFYHCFAIIEAILAMSFVGGSFISALGASPLKTLQLIEKYGVNDFLCVPSTLQALLNHPKVGEFDLSTLFAMWCGAAALPVPLWQKAIDVLGLTEAITGYGQTEVSSSGVTTEIGDPLERLSTRVGRPKLGGVSGVPEFQQSAVQYKTIDIETGTDLAFGEIGELAIRGKTVTHGYYKKPEETEAAIDKDGWLRTGDVGKIDEHGYLQVIGRSKEMFKVSGELVAPREVENVIFNHPKVELAQVIGVKDAITMEIGAAFIELKDGMEMERKEIVNWCAEQLAKFKVPRHIWLIDKDDWPMTSTGKIQKFRLQVMAKERLSTNGENV